MSTTKAASTTPKYMIGTVTKRTGLSVDVVRVWERRYGAIRPKRSEGGTRLYSDADVLRLSRLKQAVELGYSIGQAARLSESELDELIADSGPALDEPDPRRDSRERFLQAIQAMDVATAEKELTLAATLNPPGEFARTIVGPILQEVGERWAHREIGIAHEHLATGLLRAMLFSLLRLHQTSTNGRPVVLATLPGEQHEFGLLLAGLLAAAKGWRVVYLGVEVPAADVALTVRLTGAQALALSIPTWQQGTVDELEALTRTLPASTQVWVGGAEAINHRPVINRTNWTVVRDLDELEDRL